MMKKNKGNGDKRQAFMSFLEAPTSTDSFINETANKSDNQQYDEVMLDSENCNICNKAIDPFKKKSCAFCTLPACTAHMRKKRIKKKKWEKICDNCQDRHLYDCYMKVQLKAQQALGVEQQIVTMKHNQMREKLDEQTQKRRQISFKQAKLKEVHQKKLQQIKDEQDKLLKRQILLENEKSLVKNIEDYCKRMENSIKENYQEDFKILSQTNQTLQKELMTLQKRCQDIRKTIDKREKQLEDAYEKWQSEQYRKSIIQQARAVKNQSSCEIF